MGGFQLRHCETIMTSIVWHFICAKWCTPVATNSQAEKVFQIIQNSHLIVSFLRHLSATSGLRTVHLKNLASSGFVITDEGKRIVHGKRTDVS